MTTVTVNTARQLRRATDFSGVQTAVLFFVFTLMVSIPIITHPLPPLEDYVNHLARMHVIAAVGGDADLTRFYAINWQIIPNLVMDLVVPALVRLMNVYQAGQVFTVATFTLLLSGALAINRALYGRWSVLPLVLLPLLYNHVLLVGTMNYLFGAGVALWGLAFWLWLRDRAWPLRFVVSTAVVLVLFFCHLSAAGLYGLGLLAIELWRLWQNRQRPIGWRLLDFVATGLPFLPVVPLLLKSPTWGLKSEFFWEQQGKIDGLIYVIEVYSDLVAFALAAIMVSAAAWAVRHRLLRMHPIGFMLLAVGGFVYLIMPRVMFATYMADQRLPIALAFMVIACLHLELRHRLVRRGFLALLMIVVVVRVIEVDVNWAALSSTTSELRDSIKRIKRGSTVLVAYADRSAGDEVRDLGLVHAACIAMIERSALVTTAFTVDGKQIMHVRPPFNEQVDTEDGTPPTVEQLLVAAQRPGAENSGYWQAWTSKFDYVFVMFSEPESDNPAPEFLTLIHDGERFQLYRVNKRNTAKQ
jgi:hypothetical protein